MKFYMTPGSCSTGIHVLLEELELVFEAHIINLMKGDQYKPEYLAINPRGSVPALVLDDGRALTEFKSIAWWLGENYPKKKLLPESEADKSLAERLIDYAVGVVHGEGFTRVFVADRYASDAAGKASVQGEGVEIVEHGLFRLERMISGPTFVLERFSVADAALFYIEFWADNVNIKLPAKCQAHLAAMMTRPAVRQVLAEEGYRRTLERYPAAPPRLRRLASRRVVCF